MGDRGNIVVINKRYGSDDYEGVWLYSHWGGYRLKDSVEKVMARTGRIGDPTYLTRQIFCQMIADSISNQSTGLSGMECIDDELDPEKPAEAVAMLRTFIEEFMSETSFGIGTEGAGDQEYPTVCVDGDTGEVWYDASCPTTTKQIVENHYAKEGVTA